MKSGNENCVLIAAPDSAKRMLDADGEVAGALIICMFAEPGTVLVAKQEDWNRMVDNGEVWGYKRDSDKIDRNESDA